MIALATCPGGMMLHNGQEWGQYEDIWEDDSNASPADARVQARPLLWAQESDSIGQTLQARYSFLMTLRDQHPGLRTPNFYPDYYDQQWTAFSPDGYGINESLQIAIYQRWGNDDGGNLERFIVVLNFGDDTQYVNIPFSVNGNWTDLLNGNRAVAVGNYWLYSYPVPSNWGCVFWH